MTITRRGFAATLAGLTATAASAPPAAAAQAPAAPGFKFCLNTATVRTAEGKSRPLTELIDIAAKAGYDAIEPWISEIKDHLKIGAAAAELGKRIADAGLTVPDAICFAEWIVDDPARRKRGLETTKRDMDLVQRIGGQRIAAPPVGATALKATEPAIDLSAAAERYRELFDLGKTMGIVPIVEIWGFSKTLRRLGEAALIAVESHADGAAILPDVYHLYKGGSDFDGLKLLSGAAIGIFHVNDYPKIDRAAIGDADRVYPGDGIAPWPAILAALRAGNYRGHLSVELFNRDYWKQDPHTVAAAALRKLKALT